MADWQVGDLALCVRHDPLSNYTNEFWKPAIGSVSTVSDVFGGEDLAGLAFVALDFIEDKTPVPLAGFDAAHFVKVTPGANIEGIEEPRRVKVDA